MEKNVAFKAVKLIAFLGVFIYAGDKQGAIRLDMRTANVTVRAEKTMRDLTDGFEKQHDISEPLVRAEMTDAEFNAMMQDGLSAAKADHSSAASEVFTDLRRGLCI